MESPDTLTVDKDCILVCSQRLSEDSNPAIARAANKAIYELKKQWEIEEGDSWRFTQHNHVGLAPTMKMMRLMIEKC